MLRRLKLASGFFAMVAVVTTVIAHFRPSEMTTVAMFGLAALGVLFWNLAPRAPAVSAAAREAVAPASAAVAQMTTGGALTAPAAAERTSSGGEVGAELESS